jgi:hypothetical protein
MQHRQHANNNNTQYTKEMASEQREDPPTPEENLPSPRVIDFEAITWNDVSLHLETPDAKIQKSIPGTKYVVRPSFDPIRPAAR